MQGGLTLKRILINKIAAKNLAIDKYRLWLEQNCQCIYTGKVISISDLFNDNIIDFEHTIPRSISLIILLQIKQFVVLILTEILKEQNTISIR
ncbi:MAG: hypothetical protein IPH18_16670 [Chitinophagaceae bacterium]|nr:hypothetical protein [Chitinophagaceae bacterium]